MKTENPNNESWIKIPFVQRPYESTRQHLLRTALAMIVNKASDSRRSNIDLYALATPESLKTEISGISTKAAEKLIEAAKSKTEYGTEGECYIIDRIAKTLSNIADFGDLEDEDEVNGHACSLESDYGSQSALEGYWTLAEGGVDQGTDGNWANMSDEESADFVKYATFRICQGIGDGTILYDKKGDDKGILRAFRAARLPSPKNFMDWRDCGN